MVPDAALLGVKVLHHSCVAILRLGQQVGLIERRSQWKGVGVVAEVAKEAAPPTKIVYPPIRSFLLEIEFISICHDAHGFLHSSGIGGGVPILGDGLERIGLSPNFL